MAKTQRLDKVLSNSGYGSRKEIKQAVKDGQIKVDGIMAEDGGQHVDPVSQIIEINGGKLNYRQFIYLMMNKPEGVISATEDLRQKTVLDIVPAEYRHFELFPAGRLDIDTEGLLLLTNDGQMAHEMLSPKKHVPKRYYARVKGKVTEKDREEFKKGVVLEDGYKTLPAELYILKSADDSEIELVIYEGKFHQVKRMFEAAGKKVTYLKRLEMGPIKLDKTLMPGESREISEVEIARLKEYMER